MTVLTAMLNWYDEPPELLFDCARSLEGFADRIVALDGRYRLMPGDAVNSPAEQTDAIRDGAHFAGVACEVHPASGPWWGQVQKRDTLVKIASQGSDWVMPVDADWRVGGDVQVARGELERGSAVECFHVTFLTPRDPERELVETSATEWHRHAAIEGATTMPLVYRVYAAMRQVDHHWWFSGVSPEGERVAYWGEDGRPAAWQLLPGLTVEHRTHFRDGMRLERGRVFATARDAEVSANAGVEA